MKPTVQVYSNYTEEDFKVWKILYNRQMELLETNGAAAFLQAQQTIGFTPHKIPDFIEMNGILAQATGWHILTVPELCPASSFFAHLAAKNFTATCWLRKYSQLDYLEEPDMFHDIFGHAPLLSNPDYCSFFQQLGRLAVTYAGNADIIDQIERLYWFTIEFGLMEENGQLKIYGAGIISSRGETLHVLGKDSIKTAFNLQTIINRRFRNDVIQPEYFVIESFGQLLQALDEFKEVIAAQPVLQQL